MKVTLIFFHLICEVPPQSSVILNEKGEAVSRTVHKDGSSEITDNLIFGVLEPFNEGSTLILTCDVIGGKFEFERTQMLHMYKSKEWINNRVDFFKFCY